MCEAANDVPGRSCVSSSRSQFLQNLGSLRRDKRKQDWLQKGKRSFVRQRLSQQTEGMMYRAKCEISNATTTVGLYLYMEWTDSIQDNSGMAGVSLGQVMKLLFVESQVQ